MRGLVPEQLDEQVARAIGAAFAQVVVRPEGAAGVVIGHDMRPSSPSLSQAFAEGVAAHGIDVTLIGLCSTDGLYYASGALDLPGAMFTASHNPAQYNGIKLCRVRRAPGRPGQRARRDPRPGAAVPRRTRRALRPPTSSRHDHASATRSPTTRRSSGRWSTSARTDRSRSSSTPATAWAATPCPPCSAPPPGSPAAAGDRAAVLRARRHVPEPRGQPARAGEPARPAEGGRRARRRPRPRVRRRRRPLLRHRRARRAGQSQRDHRAGRDPRDRPGSGPRHPGRGHPDRPQRHHVARRPGDHRRERRQAGPHAGGPLVHQGRDGHAKAVFGGEHSAHYYFRDFWFADTGMLAALHVLAALGEAGRAR